jgi:hypothetical protein
VKIIRKLWEHWYRLWKLGNQAVHGHDTCLRQDAEQMEVFLSLEEIYSSRPHLEPSVQRLLFRSVTDHQQLPLWATRTWVTANRRILYDSAQPVPRAAIQGELLIFTYFHHRPPAIIRWDSATSTVSIIGVIVSGNIDPCRLTVPHWT